MLKQYFSLLGRLTFCLLLFSSTAMAANDPVGAVADSPEGNVGLTSEIPVLPDSPPAVVPDPPPPPPWKNKICVDPRTEVQCGHQDGNVNNQFEVLCFDFEQINAIQAQNVQDWIHNDHYIPFIDGNGNIKAIMDWWDITSAADYQTASHADWWGGYNYWYNAGTGEQGERYDISVASNANDTTIRPYVQNCIWKPTENWANPLVCGCGRRGGCFPPGVKILLSDGTQKNVEELSAGDYLWNPIKKRAVRIKGIVEGPEALPLLEVAYDGGSVRVSQQHPVHVASSTAAQFSLTPVSMSAGEANGRHWRAVKASALKIGDIVQGSDGKPHPVTAIRPLPVEEGQIVINFQLDTPSRDPEDRAIVSDGIVTGDFTLQSLIADEVQNKQEL